ncbi:MAG TPA: serine hydrolase [bacterium]|nr:serine hydrolase [bacterium]
MGTGSHQFRVAFVLKGETGEYHNIDDGIHAEPMTVEWNGEKLRAQTKGGGSLELWKVPDGKTLEGTFKQGPGTDAQLSLVALRESFAVTLRPGDGFLKPRLSAEGEALSSYHYEPPKELSDGWETGDLRQEKADLPRIETVIRDILKAHDPYIHGLVLVKDGKLVLDEYFYGYGPQDAHPIQSITKNVFSLLFGIAESQGLCDLSQKLYDSFPDHRGGPGWDARKDRITLGMLLDMTSGLGCDDLGDSKDCSWAMVKFPDWLDFSFSLPQNSDPGKNFAYCGACLTPLGVLLEKQSRMTLPVFAQKYLFGPLGIAAPSWWEGPKGIHVPAFGISLSPRDMAKLGYLVLKKGNWQGRQVVPEKWIAQSTSPLVPNTKTGKEADYGYLWWERNVTWKGKKLRSFDAWGVGGQHLFIVPDLGVVCVLTGGNTRAPHLANNSFKIFHEVLEALN